MESFHVSRKRKWLLKSTGDVSAMKEGKNQTALGSGEQRVHGNRAASHGRCCCLQRPLVST